MTNQSKYLIAGLLAAGAVGYWWYSQHAAASADIVSQPPVPSVPGPASGISAAPVGTSTTPAGQDVTQLTALLAWAQTTANPTLYAQMINGLTPGQLSSLYDILTTDWDVAGGTPTTAQTAFWNSLVAQYPFLRTGGKGCTTLQC